MLIVIAGLLVLAKSSWDFLRNCSQHTTGVLEKWNFV